MLYIIFYLFFIHRTGFKKCVIVTAEVRILLNLDPVFLCYFFPVDLVSSTRDLISVDVQCKILEIIMTGNVWFCIYEV